MYYVKFMTKIGRLRPLHTESVCFFRICDLHMRINESVVKRIGKTIQKSSEDDFSCPLSS